jgi:UDP-N-acetylmuramate dehydrogenase
MTDSNSLRLFIEKTLRGKLKPASIRYNEPMLRHTTFKTGGPADIWLRPGKENFPACAAALLAAARAEGIPVFILGGGANLLVSDRGIRGIVLDTGAWRGIGKREEMTTAWSRGKPFSVKILSGTSSDGMCERLALRGLSGMEFLAGMPGSVGGAVWMNARCYGKEIADVLSETEILDEEFKPLLVPYNAEDFGYKKSPYQKRGALILSARFAVEFKSVSDIRKEMAEHRRDRREKGHYSAPSAGSVFKNNRDFGAPTGKIIGDLGLRGLSSGGAQLAPWHGNIIINTGGASSADIRSLINKISDKVKEEKGFTLEPEIIFAGEW